MNTMGKADAVTKQYMKENTVLLTPHKAVT